MTLHDSDDPLDADEAWLRDALASLARPAMPPAVAARLDAAIAASDVTQLSARAAPAVPAPRQLPARRRQPWAAGLIGTAAALVAFGMIDPLGVVGGGARDPGSEQSQAADAAAPESAGAGLAPDASAPQQPAAGPAEPGLDQVIVASETQYTLTGLAQQAAAVAAEGPAEAAGSDPIAEAWKARAAGMAAATTDGVRQCVAGLPTGSGPLVYVDRATYEGSPAVVVARSTGPGFEVFVLAATCTAADPSILVRATVEAPRTGE